MNPPRKVLFLCYPQRKINLIKGDGSRVFLYSWRLHILSTWVVMLAGWCENQWKLWGNINTGGATGFHEISSTIVMVSSSHREVPFMLGLHWTPEGLGTDLRPKNGQTRSYSGVGQQGHMFLLCCSPEGHKLPWILTITRAYLPLKSTSSTTTFNHEKQSWNFTCKWANSQLDPPLVRSLCRLVIIHSMASYIIRHSRKSVANV